MPLCTECSADDDVCGDGGGDETLARHGEGSREAKQPASWITGNRCILQDKLNGML